jgi:hypothetical protein
MDNQLSWGEPLIRLDEIQDLTKEYWDKFEERSTGFQLPEIEYIGSLEGSAASAPIFLVAVPIKNQEEGIAGVLDALFNSLTASTSVGLVFDNCTDKSLERVKQLLINLNETALRNVCLVHIFVSKGELFEATCENFIFTLENAQYFMSLQADIYLIDSTFQSRVFEAFALNLDLFALSGRAIVSFKSTIRRNCFSISILTLRKALNKVTTRLSRVILLLGHRFQSDYFGDLSEFPKTRMLFFRQQLRTVYLGDAPIRGPLVWRAAYFKELGGLDDIGFYLGRDDCDLSLRAFTKRGWRSGYIPTMSYSIPNAGTTRKLRTVGATQALKEREALSLKFPGQFTVLQNSKGISTHPFAPKLKIRLPK